MHINKIQISTVSHCTFYVTVCVCACACMHVRVCVCRPATVMQSTPFKWYATYVKADEEASLNGSRGLKHPTVVRAVVMLAAAVCSK